ncbi:replication initiation protein [Arthrobacter phage Persistence]|uniref:Uncharacterized protein n=1 Tax=Arthrobacter phage Persistence TaxID=2836007 RepID=A0A8F3IKU2_9CAUD|nr:replication initiation protein [Arthrobacter phage Persistence]QWY79702.1 hypothetical protein SEA_PERSISTENCE_74 [Arthrobacter phage Persistence]
MRIRSTKPEFWKSRRIASVSWDARLVLKGLESYVDDNGVGIDDIELIVTDVFPRDMFAKGSETVARVSEAISELHRAGLVHRYEARGDRLLYISWWESIQRIDKPGKGRNPRPDGTFDYKESEIRESVASPPETLAPGTGEQGNRGSGEQGAVVPLRNYVSEREVEVSRRTAIHNGANIVNAFNNHIPETLPSKTRQDLTAHVTVALQDGIAEKHIRRGIELWYAKALGPGALPGFIFEAQREANGGGPAVKPRQATGSERAIAALELANHFREQESMEGHHAQE